MVTRRFATLLLLTVALAGCANNGGAGSTSAASAPSSSASTSPASASSGSASPGSASPGSSGSVSRAPSVEPSGKPTAAGARTISGTVVEGVEPQCLILRDSGGSHVLFFDDETLRAAARVGSRVTLTGRSEPTMMTTCQQGVAFIVSSVKPG